MSRLVCVQGSKATVKLDPDVNLAANSDAAVPTQKAVKAYILEQAASSEGEALAAGKILLGNAQGVAAAVTPTGDVTMTNTGVTAIAADSIVDADVKAAAAIAYSKLATLDSTYLLVGDNAGVPTKRAVTGDVTISNTGATAIGAGKVTSAMLGANVGLVVAASGGKTMTREENVAGLSSAITLVNEARGDIINHFADAVRHSTAAHPTTGIAAAADDLASLLALAGELLTLFAAHNTDAILASGWAYHTAQTADKVLVSDVTPTTLVEAVTRLNDLKAKYNAHEIETVGHDSVGTVTADQVAAANAAYGSANLVPIAGVAVGDIVFWSILDDGTGNVTGVSAAAATGGVTFTFSADPQNDAVISYMAVRPAA